MQNATASKKKEILELNERGRDLNATQQKWLKLANKLEKRIATMQEIEDEVSKSKSLNRDIKETTNQLRLLETSIRDMEAQDAFLQQQVSKEYQKLMKMKQNFQEKNEAINASLCEGLERKRAVAQEQSESEKKLKHLELLIQTKDEQIKRSQEHHAYNKELLWTKFKQLRKQVSAYHDELNSALKPIPF